MSDTGSTAAHATTTTETPPAKRGASRADTVAGIVLGLIVVVALSLVTLDAVQASDPGPGTNCESATHPPTPLGPGTIDPESIPAVGEQDQLQVRDMGRERERITLRTFLRLSRSLPTDLVPPKGKPGAPEGVAYLNVQTGPFQREDGVQLAPEHVVASAQVSMAGRRETLMLELCFDPVVETEGNDEPTIAAPGGYTGTVYVDDPRVTGGTATYTVNMKFRPMSAVLAAVGWGGLLGALTGLALATGVSWNTLWMNKGRTLSAIVAGVVAVYTVYVAQYDNDPSWQGDTSLFIALFATSVGAAYAAVNVAGTLNFVPAKERTATV